MTCQLAQPAVEIRLVDPLLGAEWDRLVQTHPAAGFFHTSAWAKVLSTTYGHRPCYLHFVREGETLALVPLMEVQSCLTGRRGVSLPFTDRCGPLLFDETASPVVLDALSELARNQKWRSFETRGGRLAGMSATPSVAFYEHTLDLCEIDAELKDRCKSSVRRAIRKAQGSGLTTEVSRTREGVLEFYRLHVRTRRRHGLPPQSLRFFLNIYQEVIRAGLGFIVLARQGVRAAAAAVFFHAGKKAIYKFGASDESLQEFRGNNLAMWAGIQALTCEGFETLHFGRTSLANEGLRRFKLSWGAAEDRLEYFKFEPATEKWTTSRDRVAGFHTQLFSRLPLALNRLAGAILYPHLD